MKTIELVPDIYSSKLGFGCAAVAGSVDRATALRAMAIASDEGVTHFDVAPSYGYGEAESILGEFLAKSKNDRLVVASKFGIEATRAARVLRPVKSLARHLLRSRNKGNRTAGAKAMPKVGSSLLRPIPITGIGLAQSVEQSLKRLKRDRLDYLFLHEPQDQVMNLDEVMRAVENLKRDGKVRAFGLSFMRNDITIHGGYLGEFDVLQFDAPSPTESVPLPLQRPAVLFSPFQSRPESTAHSEHLVDISRAFPNAVLLCSMFTEANIRMNAKAFQQ